MNLQPSPRGVWRAPAGAGSAPLVISVAVVLALMLGVLVGLGAGIYGVVLVGGIAGLFLITRPTLMFPLLLLLIFALDGLAQTLLGIGQLQWVISGLGLAMLVSYLLRLSTPAHPPQQGAVGLTMITSVALLFFAVLVFSSAVNQIGVGQAIVGLRSYLALWGVFFFVAAGYFGPEAMRRVFWVLLVFAVIQWPFAMYQSLFVAKEREALRIAGSSWDSVVGLFGGSKFGGGQSSSLGIFLVAMIIVAVSLKWHGLIKARTLVFVVLSALIGLGLAETKVVFVLIPVGLAILFRGELLRRPLLFIGGSLGVAVFLGTVLFAYHTLYWKDRTRLSTADDIVERFTYSFKPDYYAGGFWPGRVTALRIWNERNHLDTAPVSTLVGNGAAAAVSASTLIGQGVLTQRFGIGLEASGASKLLWETGILGLFSFLALAAAGYRSAALALRRGVAHVHDRALLRAVQAMLPMYALVVFYETTVVAVPPMQFMFMLSLGYSQYWYLKTRPARR